MLQIKSCTLSLLTIVGDFLIFILGRKRELIITGEDSSTILIFQTCKSNISPTWGWVSVVKSVTALWGLHTVCNVETRSVTIFRLYGHDAITLTCYYLRVGREKFLCNHKIKQQVNTTCLIKNTYCR